MKKRRGWIRGPARGAQGARQLRAPLYKLDSSVYRCTSWIAACTAVTAGELRVPLYKWAHAPALWDVRQASDGSGTELSDFVYVTIL